MEHTFFTEKLTEFLLENHPDLIVSLADGIDSFIEFQAQRASQELETLIKEGVHQDVALERAMAILKGGLLFSRYNMIDEILQEYFYETYEIYSDPAQRKAFIVHLIPKCEDVFQKYDCSDSYSYSDTFETELIGAIDEILVNQTTTK